MKVEELRLQCKQLNIRGYSKMNKAQLENAIYIKQISDWYDDLLMIKPEEIDISLDIISQYSNETNQC
jgi:uncharacterized protein (UPF0254 family)